MIRPITVVRASFEAQAFRVTHSSIDEVAEWCGGVVVPDTAETRLHIRVPIVGHGMARRSTAFIGYWVLKSGENFKVYSNKSYAGVWRPKKHTIDPVTKRAMVENLLKEFLSSDIPVSTAVEQYSSKIMKLI